MCVLATSQQLPGMFYSCGGHRLPQCHQNQSPSPTLSTHQKDLQNDSHQWKMKGSRFFSHYIVR